MGGWSTWCPVVIEWLAWSSSSGMSDKLQAARQPNQWLGPAPVAVRCTTAHVAAGNGLLFLEIVSHCVETTWLFVCSSLLPQGEL